MRRDAAGELVSVEAGEADVDQRRIRSRRNDTGQPLRAVGGLFHRVAVESEQLDQRLAHVHVVLDDDDAHAGPSDAARFSPTSGAGVSALAPASMHGRRTSKRLP